MSARYFNEVNPDGPLAGTKCPVSPGRLRELYEGGWREEDGKRVWCEPMGAPEIALHLNKSNQSVLTWLHKSGVNIRSRTESNRLSAKKYKSYEKAVVARVGKGVTEKQIASAKNNIRLAISASIKSRRNTKIVTCHNPDCGKNFFVRQSQIKYRGGKYCSRSCSAKMNSPRKRGAKCFTDVWCVRCFCLSLTRAGKDKTGKVIFKCVKCGRASVNPLLEEPTPRQVLERHRELRAQGITLREVPALELSAL